MIDITLDIKGNGQDLLKINWRSPVSDDSFYEINANRLTQRSVEVRERLQDLITVAMKNSAARRPLSLGREMKALARAGRKLRDAIFFTVAGWPDDEGSKAGEWLASLDDAVLHVTVDRLIYVPWGLVYDGDPDCLADDSLDTSIDKFREFWCVKYRVSTLYNRIRDRIVRNPRSTKDAQIVKLINADVWDRALAHVPLPEQELVSGIFKAGAISSSRNFENIWKTQKKCYETDLLYFFGHAKGTALALNKDDLLTMDNFPQILRRNPPSEKPACMVFLNGCHTAVGDDREGGFLQETAYGGFCGFVGTEAEVPDVFALRFANAFLSHLLYTGSRVIDVMDTIRRDYWPLSLAYNLSCHPDFRFSLQGERRPDLLPPPPDFSKDAIGSDRV
jgi:hypothetical protein